MDRKNGGLAAMMQKQASPPKAKKSPKAFIIDLLRSSALHIGLVVACIVYVLLGALLIRYIELPHELTVSNMTRNKTIKLKEDFLKFAERLKSEQNDESRLNASVAEMLDDYMKIMFEMYKNPISANYFDSQYYFGTEYTQMWTLDAAILFMATTVVPVGFGLVTPLTQAGRLFLCCFAICGIPLALVTISDIGKFSCDTAFKLFDGRMRLFMGMLVLLVFIYPLAGAVLMYLLSSSTMSLQDAIYFCCITIFTIGYGDINPPIPTYALILFIIIGVMLVTISVEVVGANCVHYIHYFGRGVKRAKVIAKQLCTQISEKIDIGRGIEMGIAHLNALARMGLMMNLNPTSSIPAIEDGKLEVNRFITPGGAYDPGFVDIKLIDSSLVAASYHDGYEEDGKNLTKNAPGNESCEFWQDIDDE